MNFKSKSKSYSVPLWEERFWLAAVLVLTVMSTALADVKVVDPNGGGDYLTVTEAINDLPNPGPRTIIIRAGVYNDNFDISLANTLATDETQRIVFQRDQDACPGSVVVVTQQPHAIRISRSKYLTFDGIDMQGGGRTAYRLEGGNNANQFITIMNCRIRFSNANNDSDAAIFVGSRNITTQIINNEISYNNGNGIVIDADNGGTVNGYYTFIVNNTIAFNGRNGVEVRDEEPVWLINNVITHNGQQPGTTGGRFGLRARAAAIETNVTLLNNMFYNNVGGDLGDNPVNDILDPTDSGNRTTTGLETPGIVGTFFPDGLNTHTPDEIYNYPFAPLYDFKIFTGSPVVDKGINSFIQGDERVPADDNEGDLRPYGPSVDAGMDELGLFRAEIFPQNASNPLSDDHTVNVLVLYDNEPTSQVLVTLSVTSGPNAGLTLQNTTDDDGVTTFVWSTNGPGVDLFQVQGFRGLDEFCSYGMKEWVDVQCSLTPQVDSNIVGTTHTLTYTLLQNGQPLQGVAVNFIVTSGPNAGASGSDTTNSIGQATFSYQASVDWEPIPSRPPQLLTT
ncbi:MAG: hypothetical protein Kow0059_01100 [Candidatus Sumerlaeia bacterium]